MSADPFREEWGDQPAAILMSLYAYGNHSPLGWRDPTGKVPEWLHAALDVAGMVPVIGEIADGANALIYLSEGRYTEAGISAMGMIPVLGEAGKAGKWIAKGVKAGGEAAVQKYAAKQIRGEVTQQGQKKFAKECAGGACGVPGKACFVAGTLVSTREGPKPIEEVREGEEVLSRDPSTGQLDWRPVVQTIVTPGAAVLEVTLVAEDGTREKLGVTGDHPFWVEEKGWVEAKDLELGSRIRSAKDAWLTTESIAETLARTTVYNFEVADYHTYFVGAQQAWVHNSGCGPTKPKGGTYQLKDPKTGEVVRNGRSKDLARRKADHARKPETQDFDFEVKHRTDDYSTQRGLEQKQLDNERGRLDKIRGISPENKNGEKYMRAAEEFLRKMQ